MYFLRLFFLLIFSFSVVVHAQKPGDFKQHRILILLDGSSSMVQSWSDNKLRFKAASEIILKLMDSIYRVNGEVEFGLRVYGHQHGVPENNCFDTRSEVMFSKNNITQMGLRLADLHPIGVSPIAYSLSTAAENDFSDEENYTYSLILITDGGESCGGDICDVVTTLLNKKIEFKPYIVSLVNYAPLKEQYNCLGNYLLASKPSEVNDAIRTITENYRKVLRIPIAKQKILATSKIPTPSVLKINVPAVTVKKETDAPPVIVKQTPAPAQIIKEPIKETVVVNPASKIVVNENPIKKEEIATIKTYNRLRSFALFWSTPTLKKRPIPTLILPRNEPEPVAVPVIVNNAPKPIPTPPKPASPKPKPIRSAPVTTVVKDEKKEAVFTTKTEVAAETLLDIYFTDGKGKFYQSTPLMQLINPKTGIEVKRFYRTVDANGNPDPQKLPAGNYTLVIGKKGNFIAKNVTIVADKRNKVTIIATKGTLSFGYDGNLKRPVSEFTALVKKNFEPGPVITQQCNTELEYESGNYHIEINTLPISRRTIDLDFASSYRIDISEPGFVQFTNNNSLGKVALYYQLGDQFARFYAFDITGNLELQKIKLQPGIYEAHFKRNPSIPSPDEVIQRFYVTSNQTITVELK